MFEKIKSFLDSFLDLGLPGFDFSVYKDGKPALRYMNGYSDLENKIPVNGKERYNIYSCSKVITCVSLMQLWEKGLFSLEDRLADYMPEFAEMNIKTEDGVRKAEKPILIKHLFEMTAGFSYNGLSENMMKARQETGGRCPTRETMKYLAKDPLLFELRQSIMRAIRLCIGVYHIFIIKIVEREWIDRQTAAAEIVLVALALGCI